VPGKSDRHQYRSFGILSRGRSEGSPWGGEAGRCLERVTLVGKKEGGCVVRKGVAPRLSSHFYKGRLGTGGFFRRLFGASPDRGNPLRGESICTNSDLFAGNLTNNVGEYFRRVSRDRGGPTHASLTRSSFPPSLSRGGDVSR